MFTQFIAVARRRPRRKFGQTAGWQSLFRGRMQQLSASVVTSLKPVEQLLDVRPQVFDRLHIISSDGLAFGAEHFEQLRLHRHQFAKQVGQFGLPFHSSCWDRSSIRSHRSALVRGIPDAGVTVVLPYYCSVHRSSTGGRGSCRAASTLSTTRLGRSLAGFAQIIRISNL